MVMKAIIFFAGIMLIGFSAAAQARPELYWVIETNKYQRDYSVVKFYDPDHNLVHEVRLDKRINIEKRRDRHKLDQVVSQYTNRNVAHRKRTKSKSSI
jgi:hypothetical protein